MSRLVSKEPITISWFITGQWLLFTNQNIESRQSEVTRKKDGALSSNNQPADSDADGPLKRHEISQEDHPLSLGKGSVWHQYFQVNASPSQSFVLAAFCCYHVVFITVETLFLAYRNCGTDRSWSATYTSWHEILLSGLVIR